MASGYDYEKYFSKDAKLAHWKIKHEVDRKILSPHIRKGVPTLNAGAGFFEGEALIEKKDLWGVDISKTAVKELKKKGYRGVQADLREEWPFDDAAFEQIIMVDIFEHLGQVGTFLSECSRVCKSGGTLMLGIPLLNHWKNWVKLLSGTTVNVQYDEHPRMFFDKDIKKLFGDVGFELDDVHYLGPTKGYGYYFFRKRAN